MLFHNNFIPILVIPPLSCICDFTGVRRGYLDDMLQRVGVTVELNPLVSLRTHYLFS